MTVKTTSAKETQDFGAELAKKLVPGTVVCLYGDLGAGKTTLVQGIAKGLGIKKRLVSPTFILARRYKVKNQKSKIKITSQNSKINYLWHVDLYRLNDLDEARAIGIEELMSDPTNILLIEWPEQAESILPAKRWEIKLRTISQGEREIVVKLIGRPS